MTRTTHKWLLGCGIGCGVLVLAGVFLTAGGYFLVRNIVHEVEKIEAVNNTVIERYGQIREYVPEPDGTVDPGRLEAFLTIRDAMKPHRQEMEKTLSLLSEGKKQISVSPVKIIKMIRSGVRLLPAIFDYLAKRNEVLLAEGMGAGEYTYIYTVAYYSWLGKSPEDGPPFVLMEADDEDDEDDDDWDRDWSFKKKDEWDEYEVREMRGERTRRYLNYQLLAMLRNQVAAMESEWTSAVGHDSGDQARWKQQLAREIEALENDPYRLPWEGNLPETLAASLAPYRIQLEESYSAMCNPLELGPQERGDR